jgi:hypothetical protein
MGVAFDCPAGYVVDDRGAEFVALHSCCCVCSRHGLKERLFSPGVLSCLQVLWCSGRAGELPVQWSLRGRRAV